jgi:predicted lipoprotein with Yx(FWY)xxD motif
MTHFVRTILMMAGLMAIIMLAGCGGTTTSSTSATSTPTGTALIHTATVTVNGKPETVLTNAAGFTLYYFKPDTPTKIACTGHCAQVWPPLLAPSGVPTSSPALPGKLSVLNGPNGRQVLYNGHPLYHYSHDSAPGQANGEGLFGKWFVATPDLGASTSGSTQNSSYTGGY